MDCYRITFVMFGKCGSLPATLAKSCQIWQKCIHKISRSPVNISTYLDHTHFNLLIVILANTITKTDRKIEKSLSFIKLHKTVTATCS